MNHMVRVETVLDSWKSVRQDAAQAVEEFPAVAFDFKPAAEMMTFGEIAAHILNSGHALTGMLLEGEDNITRPDFRARMAQHYPAAPKEAGPKGPAGPKEASEPEQPVVTHHTITLNGKPFAYTVTTGYLPLKNPAGETQARIFFMAYTADRPEKAPGKRPLMFSFNGGPGSSRPARGDTPDRWNASSSHIRAAWKPR
jgi:hypothetical protein